MNEKIGSYNPANMTAQEVLEASAIHLFEQSKKSTDDEKGICAYDGGDVCCAAAIFIQDYKPSYENLGWKWVSRHGDNTSHMMLIESLQLIHDGNDVFEWKEKLINLARNFELDSSFMGAWSYCEESEKYIKGPL